MPRWIGFLGSWALLVLGAGLLAIAAIGETINVRDLHRLDRVALIDQLIHERDSDKATALRSTTGQRVASISALQHKVEDVAKQAEDVPDAAQTIIVSTVENKLYVRRGGVNIFEAVCSTGKGTTLAVDGKTLVFDTPIGKFHVKQKEENPLWVPPDWHFVEEAKQNAMRTVHLNPGGAIDADTGNPPAQPKSGFWSWVNGTSSNGSQRILKVVGNTVMEYDNGVARELPPGKDIIAGNAIVIPPINTVQRHYDKVLGHYRLELGDGYGIHGTDEPDKLGQSVSHGCVRLGDDDIANLYQIANVGDEVIIY
ncbi:MAG TPA: L,D-transpeptidase [Thermoanaerobaculia bacterium]